MIALRRLFFDVRRALWASPLMLAMGCDRGVDVDLYSGLVCSESGVLAVSTLTPATPVDYIELRQVYDVLSPMVVSKVGDRCGTAANKGACESAVAALKLDHGFREGGFERQYYYLVTTRGDAVEGVTDVKPFLGEITSGEEAAFLLWSQGYDARCDDKARGAARVVPGGFEVVVTEGTTCGDDIRQHLMFVDAQGAVTEREVSVLEHGESNCVIGRRPEGLVPARAPSEGSALGRWFAESAALEAASVHAFEVLAAELAAHGAPKRLVRGALRSAREEVRHTRATSALARRFGARPVVPRVEPRPLRSLEALALDNAAEGCVRETYGALVGRWQEARALDPAVRRAMHGIAPDEERHATLAWDIHAWAHPRLSRAARARVEGARDSAFAALRAEAACEPDPTLHARAGLPSASASSALLAKLEAVPFA